MNFNPIHSRLSENFLLSRYTVNIPRSSILTKVKFIIFGSIRGRTLPLRMKIPINRFPRTSTFIFNVTWLRVEILLPSLTTFFRTSLRLSGKFVSVTEKCVKNCTQFLCPMRFSAPRDSRSYPIASGAAMPGGIHLVGSWRETTRGCCSGGRHEAPISLYYLFLGFLVHAVDAMRRSSDLKARPVVEPRARRGRARGAPRCAGTFAATSRFLFEKKRQNDAGSSADCGNVRDSTKTANEDTSVGRAVAVGRRDERRSPDRFLPFREPLLLFAICVSNASRSRRVRCAPRHQFPDHQTRMCECGFVFVRTIHEREMELGMTID